MRPAYYQTSYHGSFTGSAASREARPEDCQAAQRQGRYRPRWARAIELTAVDVVLPIQEAVVVVSEQVVLSANPPDRR